MGRGMVRQVSFVAEACEEELREDQDLCAPSTASEAMVRALARFSSLLQRWIESWRQAAIMIKKRGQSILR